MTDSPARWEGRTAEEWRDSLALPAVRVYWEVGSTNAVARAWAEAGAPAGALVLADAQTAGRGRSGRGWWSPPGLALYASVVLRPAAGGACAEPGVVPLRVGLALADALEATYGLDARLKWPNDVQAPDGRKLAGVLCEGALAGSAATFVVAGLGVNVARPPRWPDELGGSAASVEEALGRSVRRAALLRPLAEALARLATAPVEPLSGTELARMAARDALAGRLVRIDGGAPVRARGVDASGALRVVGGPAGDALVRAGTVRVAGPHEAIERENQEAAET